MTSSIWKLKVEVLGVRNLIKIDTCNKTLLLSYLEIPHLVDEDVSMVRVEDAAHGSPEQSKLSF